MSGGHNFGYKVFYSFCWGSGILVLAWLSDFPQGYAYGLREKGTIYHFTQFLSLAESL
jgi:hypothetical protein